MDTTHYLTAFRSKIESYSRITDASWSLFTEILSFREVKKEETLLHHGEVAKTFYFIGKGALRAFFTDQEGNTYTKNLFLASDIAGSTVSCLLRTPSEFTIEALEDTQLLVFSFQQYKALIDEHLDLKNFYIAYLEQHWIIEKERREVSLVMENATVRYLALLEQHPDIEQRIQKIHIASHLGITPTQLSRIRRGINKIT